MYFLSYQNGTEGVLIDVSLPSLSLPPHPHPSLQVTSLLVSGCSFPILLFTKNKHAYIKFILLCFCVLIFSKLWPTGHLPVFIAQVLLEYNHMLSFKKFRSLIHVELILVCGMR